MMAHRSLRMSQAANVVARPSGHRSGARVYALGRLHYDFPSVASHSYFMQHLQHEMPDVPFVRSALADYLYNNILDQEKLLWTITVDEVAICVVKPHDSFGRETYALFGEFLTLMTGEDVLLSMPGIIIGEMTLLSGQVVPVIQPHPNGIYNWAEVPFRIAMIDNGVVDAEEKQQILNHIRRFQQRVYTELRNTGRTSQERALNYAVTNIYRHFQQLALNYAETQHRLIQAGDPTAADVVPADTKRKADQAADAMHQAQRLELSEVSVKQSPVCRSGAQMECWDVQLRLFDPEAPYQKARQVYKFTVDISDIQPVMINDMEVWSAY